MSLKKAWMLAMGLLLVVGILGCGEKPGPVEEPKAAPKPGLVAQPGGVAEPKPVAEPTAVAEPRPVAEPETVAEPESVAEAPRPTIARVIGRNEAIAEIDKLGGTYQCDENSPDRRIVGVALRGPLVTDASLEQMKGLPSLNALFLNQARVTDAGLDYLKELTSLQVLSLENTKITDAGLERLKGLSSLRHLFLGATQVTDAGVNELTKALPNVTVRREVVDPRMAGEDAKRTPVREAGRDVAITVIERLRGRYQCDEKSPDRPIVAVWLAGPQVTDDALKYLSRLTCLGSLTLEGAPVTDAGLEHLKGLTNLQELFLRCPRVTDASLEHLKGLTNLRTLRLHDTQVTFAGVIELRRALPESTWLEVEPKPAPPPKPGRDAVIAAIEKLGGKYQCDEQHPDKPIVKVWLHGPQVTDAALRNVAALPNLKFLFLGGTQVTDLEVHRFQMAFPNVVVKVDREQPKRTEPEVGRDAAIAAIEKLGGRYRCDEESPDKPIVGVRLFGRQVTNAELYYLEGLTSLRYLDLSGSDVTDAGLLHLMGLTNLERLGLNETQITGTGFEHLKGLSSLREVALNDSRVTDAGLQHLKGLSSLRKLELGKTWITDASLEHLKEMARLETLNLSFTEVTDAGVTELRKTHKALQNVTASGGVDQPTVFAEVEPQTPPHAESIFGEPKPTAPETGRDAAIAMIKKLGGTFQTKAAGGPITRVFFSVRRVIDADLEHLKGLTSLQELMLHGSRVTGTGLEHLKGLTSLQALSLEGSNITDAGLEHLKELTSLKSLSLKGSKITDAGLMHLKGLPRLQVLNLLDTQVTDAGMEHLKGKRQI